MIVYGFKSILCLGFLWGFYKIFLEKERVHFIKRFYLLASLLFALTLPLITLTYEKETVQTNAPMVGQGNYLPENSETFQPAENSIIVATAPDFSVFVGVIYVLGVFVFGFRFINNLRRMINRIKDHEKIPECSHTNVLLNKKIIPYTFLNYIFVTKEEFQNNTIPDEVLIHEKTHVSQKHTWDIVVAEALQVIFWFNPVIVQLIKAIRLNHEFLADQNVLKQEFSIHTYIELLVSYPNGSNQTGLASPINYSLTKKRLQMMTTNFSGKRVALKLCALIPVVTGCILLFNNKIVAKDMVKTEDYFIFDDAVVFQETQGSELDKQTLMPMQDQEGIPEEDLRAYKKWIKGIKKQRKNGISFRLEKEEVDQMEALYNAMSVAQKRTVEKLTDIIPSAVFIKNEEGTLNGITPPSPPGTPLPPKAPKPPVAPAKDFEKMEIDEEAIEKEIALMHEEEQVMLEEIERDVEEAMIEAEEARMEAIVSMEEAEVERAMAMEMAQISRRQAQAIRKQAMEHAEQARVIAMEAAQKAKIEARTHALASRTKTLEHAAIARENAMETRKMAQKLANEARKRAEKERMESMVQAEFARTRAERARSKAARAFRDRNINTPKERSSSLRLIKEMARNDAEFYHKGNKIDAKTAMEIVREAGDKLSIDAKTKNGKSKVKIRD